MGAKRSYQQRVDLVKESNPSFFETNYSVEEKSTQSGKLYVVCKICGHERNQVVESIMKGCGCKICTANQAGSKNRLTTAQFISNVLSRHPENYRKFDYTKTMYVKANKKLTITCLSCGKDFQQTANDHYSGKGCSYCVGRNCDTNSFISKVLERFPSNSAKFDYSLVEYVSDTSPIKIGCKICGKHFIQTPTKHYQGHGCNLHSGVNGGFKSDRDGYFYITKWSSNFGEFVKVGITSVGSENRATKQKLADYEYEILFEYKADGGSIMSLESYILKKYSTERGFIHKPLFPDGYTETFSPALLDDLILSAKEYINEQSS